MSTAVELIARVQKAISMGEIKLPLRQGIPLPDSQNHLLLMPGALTDPPVFGAKLLSLFPDNGRADLPAIQGHVLLFSSATGAPLALVEAASLTAIRTAAASAAATRALANADASRLALLGYGVQAASHLEAMCTVRPVREVRVWGPDLRRSEEFVAHHQTEVPSLLAVETAEAALREADLVCAVSASTTPIIRAKWLSPGCHLNLVGAHSPTDREADGATLAQARVFTEITEFALVESGDILLAIREGMLREEDIAGEIGAVLNGTIAGRTSPDQITLYKSLGNTAQDLIAAHQVYASSLASA